VWINKALISFPSKGPVDIRTSRWARKTQLQMGPAKVDVDDILIVGPTDVVRNTQIRRFLSSPFEFLFLLDSDLIPKPGTLQKLLAYDLPFVSAPGITLKNNKPIVMCLDKVGKYRYRQHSPLEGLQKCDAVGSAGMLIHRDVCEKLKPPWFHTLYNEDRTKVLLGQDFHFCEKLAEAGIEVWADCDLIQIRSRCKDV